MLVGVSLGSHDGGADLAEADAVSPSCSGEGEMSGDAVDARLCVDDEGGAVEVRFREGAAYFEFFADDAGVACAGDFQFFKSP